METPSAVNEVFTLDPSDMTVGELVDLVDVAGDDAVADLAAGKTSARLILGLVWIVGRRRNPDWSLDDARAVKVVSLDFAGANSNGDGTGVGDG